jgi:type I restriction enzyme, S subunit
LNASVQEQSNRSVSLEDICSNITDGKHGDCQNQAGSGFYFLSCKDIHHGMLNYETAREITEADFVDTHKRTRLEPADVVLTNSGTIGRLAMAPDNVTTRRTTFQKSVAILKPRKTLIEPAYLLYRLEYEMPRLIEFAGGTAQKNLLLRDLRAFRIDLPPLNVQRRIAAVISAYDDLIENNNRRMEILEEIAQLIYRDWFIDFRYPGYRDVSLVDSELGLIPRGWALLPASEAMTINPKIVVDRSASRPFIPMTSVSESVMNITPIEQRSGATGARFQNEDTLFARITPCLENGKTAYVQFLDEGEVASGSTEFIVLRTEQLSPEYVYLLARSDSFRSHAIKSMSGASGRQRVRDECFNSFLLAVPPPGLLQSFTVQVQPLFELSYKLFTVNMTLRSSRDLLLPRLLSGEIDVSNLDIAMPGSAA